MRLGDVVCRMDEAGAAGCTATAAAEHANATNVSGRPSVCRAVLGCRVWLLCYQDKVRMAGSTVLTVIMDQW